MPTMHDIQDYLHQNGPATARDLAESFYPVQSAIGQMNGGPTRGGSIMLRLLGRMEKRGLVGRERKRTAGPTVWYGRGVERG